MLLLRVVRVLMMVTMRMDVRVTMMHVRMMVLLLRASRSIRCRLRRELRQFGRQIFAHLLAADALHLATGSGDGNAALGA